MMSKPKVDRKSRAYQWVVTGAGASIWLIALVNLATGYPLRDQLVLLALAPLATIVGMFPVTFPLPSGLHPTREKINFTLSDAFVLLVACWYGILPAVFVAGIEGFTASRRAVRRLSSNLFSFGMMSFASAAAATSLAAVLRYAGGGGEGTGRNQSFTAITVALLAASVVLVVSNLGLLSTLLALRHRNPIMRAWKENFLCAAPMFLPTSVAASLMYLAIQYDMLVMVVISGPILIAIYFGHRQYRDSVHERINFREKAHRETIEALAVAINAKDEVTHEHVLRVQIYAAGVARLLGCDETEIEALRAGALLHDIGKIAVPDYILNKPGKLTAAEFEKMKMHTIFGAQILGRVEFPYPVVPVVRHHHERWDGKGYPDGLKGEDIPLTARILSVVDCFDAVREDRQYRKAMTREEAVAFIMDGSGTMYDPRVVGTFLTYLPQFEAEIMAHRDAPVPSFGIEPVEQLSEAARLVAPAAGLAEATASLDRTELAPREAGALEHLAQALSATRETQDMLAAFAEHLRAIVPYDSCAVSLVAPETGAHVVAHAAGRHAELLCGRNVPLGEGVTGWVFANRQPFCNTDPKLDLPPALAAHFADYRTLAVFPILDGAEMRGTVALYSSALARYDDAHQARLVEATALLANALPTERSAPMETTPPVTAVRTDAQPALDSFLTH